MYFLDVAGPDFPVEPTTSVNPAIIVGIVVVVVAVILIIAVNIKKGRK